MCSPSLPALPNLVYKTSMAEIGSVFLKWRKVWGGGGGGGGGGSGCEISNDERYQRGYLYRRGGMPKGGAGITWSVFTCSGARLFLSYEVS
jgi:hypothetical protein